MGQPVHWEDGWASQFGVSFTGSFSPVDYLTVKKLTNKVINCKNKIKDKIKNTFVTENVWDGGVLVEKRLPELCEKRAGLCDAIVRSCAQVIPAKGKLRLDGEIRSSGAKTKSTCKFQNSLPSLLFFARQSSCFSKLYYNLLTFFCFFFGSIWNNWRKILISLLSFNFTRTHKLLYDKNFFLKFINIIEHMS